MDHYASSNSYSVMAAEHEEVLYCSAPQNPEDIICDGSDIEQTAEEIRKKRRRYEGSARRYLCGHISVIQSASLRGPLDRESGWVNPWRYRPPREEDWWRPGSEDMLFTRDNVMRRAADHGLAYLTPREALAWCKAAAETEARKELGQFDSMEAVQSGESNVDDTSEESPIDGPEGQSDSSSKDDGHQTNPDPTNCPIQYPNVADRFTRATKRPADLQWLKGSYISKRARWVGPPVSSPTPMPNQHNERDKRHRQSPARSAGSDNGRPNLISKPKTSWSYETQQRGTVSPYSGSTAQGPESKNSGRICRQQLENMDELQEDSRDTTLVSAPNFLSRYQGQPKKAPFMDQSYSDLDPDNLIIVSARNTSTNTPAARSGTSASRRSRSGSNKLTKLPGTPETSVDVEFVEDDSFITEVAPSSRNLEKFQYRKKRGKSKKHQPKEEHEGSYKPLENATRSLSEQAPADEAEESFTSGLRITVNPDQQSQLETPDREENEDSETTPIGVNGPGFTLSLKDDATRMQKEPSPGRASSQFDESYFKKVVMMPDNFLPSFGTNSPFAPFAPFKPMAFGPLGASKATPTPSPASANRLAMVKDGQHPASTRPANITVDDAPAPFLVRPENQDPAMSTLQIAADTPLKRHTQSSHPPTNNLGSISRDDYQQAVDAGSPPKRSKQSSHAPTKSIVSTSLEDHQQVVVAPMPDCDALSMGSSEPQEVEELEKVLSSNVLPDSPEKSDPMPKALGKGVSHSQITSIDDDNSTQSFNFTASKSLRKPRLSPETARNILVADEETIEDDGKLSDESHNQEETVGHIAGQTASYLCDDEANDMEAHLTEAVDSPEDEIHDEMEIIQNALSQNSGGIGSNGSSQMDNDDSSQPSVSAANTEPEPEPEPVRTTPLAPEEEDEAPVADEEQDSWEGCGPQSPWAAENLLPEPISKTVSVGELFVTVEREASLYVGGSPPRPTFEEALEWQPIERPVTPDYDGIKPLEDLASPTLSPELAEVNAEQEVVSNTQLLVEAATNNPWTSNSKKRASGNAKKRVSFGVLPSEEKPDSQAETSSFLKKGPGSPPPPQSLRQPFDEDALDDGPTAIGKFGKHFSAAAGIQHLLLRNAGSHVLSSPAVDAMADRFIAADRETSTELEHRAELSESPTRHLRPKSDARTNLSPSAATDDDMELNLDDFISDASNFLEDWSVDSEVRKTSGSKARSENKTGRSTSRSLFGFSSLWSS